MAEAAPPAAAGAARDGDGDGDVRKRAESESDSSSDSERDLSPRRRDDEPKDADAGGEGKGQGQAPRVDRGMFVMCNTSKEQRARSEALALFNHYADVWEEERQAGTAKKATAGDLLDDLRREVAGLRGPQRRFETRDTRVRGILLFVYQAAWLTEGPDPVEFVMWLVARMKQAQEYGRFVARIVPLQALGPAQHLLRNAAPVLARHFSKSDPSSFEIDFACRNNNAFSRRDVQRQLLGMGLGYPHFVSLAVPQKTILVEIANKIAGISVVPRYYTLARFNVQQPQPQQQNKPKGKQGGGGGSAVASHSNADATTPAAVTAPLAEDKPAESAPPPPAAAPAPANSGEPRPGS